MISMENVCDGKFIGLFGFYNFVAIRCTNWRGESDLWSRCIVFVRRVSFLPSFLNIMYNMSCRHRWNETRCKWLKQTRQELHVVDILKPYFIQNGNILAFWLIEWIPHKFPLKFSYNRSYIEYQISYIVNHNLSHHNLSLGCLWREHN